MESPTQVEETKSPETTEVSMFGEEKPTENELMGIATPDDDEEKPSSGDESQSGDDDKSVSAEPKDESSLEEDKSDADVKVDDKADDKVDDKADDGETKSTTPPKGFVEKGALSAERTLHKETKEKLVIVEQEVVTLRAEAAIPEEKFVRLSKDEFEELLEKDATEAAKYRVREADYDKADTERKKLTKESNSRNVARVQGGFNLIKELVPDIYEANSESSKELSTYARENGFKSGSYLSAFTDPRTIIILPGEKTPTVLGEGAAHFVELIRNANAKSKDAPTETVEEIETRVREEVVKELKDKQSSSDDSTSLGDLGGSGDVDKTVITIESEDDLVKLTPKQLAAYRNGEEVFAE